MIPKAPPYFMVEEILTAKDQQGGNAGETFGNHLVLFPFLLPL